MKRSLEYRKMAMIKGNVSSILLLSNHRWAGKLEYQTQKNEFGTLSYKNIIVTQALVGAYFIRVIRDAN